MYHYSLNLIVAIIVIASFTLFGLFKALFLLRKRFSIKANCWFCNTNLRVPYDDWNSFTCPCCHQYNGFSEDGDYNKEISEQHHSKYNSNTFCKRTNERMLSSNGFCEFCSRNQEIKVIQLANFRPRIESNYDKEVEEFKQKLEDSYQLCQQCQRHLNKTLNKVKTRFIGSKVTQLYAKNTKDSNQTAKIIRDEGMFLSTLIMTSILFLSIVNFIRDMKIELPSFDYSDRILTTYNHLHAFIFTISDILTNWMKNMELNEIEDINADKIAISALTLNLILILDNLKKNKTEIIISMLLWTIKLILNEISIDEKYAMSIEGTIAFILIASSINMFKKTTKKPVEINKNGSFRQITAEILDESDTELDCSDINSSYFDALSTRTAATVYSKPSKLNSSLRYVEPMKSFNSTIRNISNVDILNKSFSITKEVMAADRKQLQNDITRLSNKLEEPIFLSSSTIKDFNSSQVSNPFSLEKSRCGSPTPSIFSVVSNRTHLISPPRLHSPLVYANDATPSWIGGGYWLSPPKKNYINESNQFKPVISRSSSQSSGLGTIEGSEKNSRENSLSQEDTKSVFSDAASNRKSLFDKPSTTTPSLFSETYSYNQSRNHNFFNTTNFNSINHNNSFRKYRDNFFK